MRAIGLALFVLVLLAGCGQKRPPGTSEAPPSAAGGGGTDVGSASDDSLPEDKAAWFLGRDRLLIICYERADDFTATETEVRRAIENGFKEWRRYIITHFVDSQLPDEAKLATRFKLKDRCDGREDLRFYFGVETDEVITARRRFIRPLAFAQKSKAPGKPGFIWVTGDPNHVDFTVDKEQGSSLPRRGEDRLYTVVLHEIGHVYGNDHIAGTVMAENLAEKLRSGKFSRGIDHPRELSACRDCTQEYGGEIADRPKLGSPIDQPEWEHVTVTRLLGRPPHSPEGRTINFFLRRREIKFWDQLTIDEGDKSWDLPLEHCEVSAYESGLQSFRIYHAGKHYGHPDVAFVEYCSVRTPAGETWQLSIETNFSSERVRVYLLEAGLPPKIFGAVAQGGSRDGYKRKTGYIESDSGVSAATHREVVRRELETR